MLLGDLLTVLLAPYDDLDAFSGPIRVRCSRMGVGEAAATTLALVIHELATSALMYGALSVESGTLDVSRDSAEEELVVVWTERGGPPVMAPTGKTGYGSRLVARSMSGRLGGSITRDQDKYGVTITLRMNRSMLVK